MKTSAQPLESCKAFFEPTNGEITCRPIIKETRRPCNTRVRVRAHTHTQANKFIN